MQAPHPGRVGLDEIDLVDLAQSAASASTAVAESCGGTGRNFTTQGSGFSASASSASPMPDICGIPPGPRPGSRAPRRATPLRLASAATIARLFGRRRLAR